MISYSIPRKEIKLELNDKEISAREFPKPPEKKIQAKGFLGKIYPKLVGPVERGAVLEIST